MKGQSQCVAYGYVSWLEDMPFILSDNGQYEFNARIFQGATMPAIMYLAAFPEAMNVKSHGALPAACIDTTGSLLSPEEGAIVMQCGLADAKYHVDFLYQNGLPTIDVSCTPQVGSPMQTISSVNCTISDTNDGSCELSAVTMRTLSYQAIMDAFTYLITGYVVSSGNESIALEQSQVISTPLASTKELRFIGQPLLEQRDNALAKPLQQNLLAWTKTRDDGLVKTRSNANTVSLTRTIQQLFQNATISMMSQPYLR